MDTNTIKGGCMNTKDLLEQIALLTAYIEKGTRRKQTWGLCGNVLLNNFPVCDVFPSWELYSGDCAYPVGNGRDDYHWASGMHDHSTEYGKLRLALAKHCLAWCEQELQIV